MFWKLSSDGIYCPRRVISDVVLFLTVCNVMIARPSSGIPIATSVDPFAPPPLPPTNYYAPQNAPQYSQQQPQPMNGGNTFPMPQQQQQQQQQQPLPQIMNYNQRPQYNTMAVPNSWPVYPAISPMNQAPPRDAAPVGATASGTSSQGEMEFEGGDAGNGGSGSSGGGSNYIYPPNYPQSYLSRSGQNSPRSLLDAYYQTPYQQGQRYMQYQMARRQMNDPFGGMFGSTSSGNMFGAFMLNEFMF